MGANSVKLLLLCLIVGLLSGCAKDQDETWLTVGDVSVYKDEVMIYLYQTFNEFEEYGGNDVWLIEDFSGGKSAAEVAKQGAVDNLIKNKVLYQKAQELGIELDDMTRDALVAEAKSYYDLLPANFVASNDIQISTLNEIFLENYMADAVTKQTMSDYVLNEEDVQAYVDANEDYSRLSTTEPLDLLTNFRVHHLMIRTHERDENGQWSPLPEEKRMEAKDTMDVLYSRLVAGEEFISIVKEASAADYLLEQPDGLVLNKAQLSEDYKAALDYLEVGEMTDIIQGEYGYHVFYLEEKTLPTADELKTYDERYAEWEGALFAEAELSATKDAFEQIYKRWRNATSIAYFQPWTELDFIATIQSFIEEDSEQ